MGKSGGPSLPRAWISGFYDSGKSSFAKLLGLALDGLELPNGQSLAEALLTRDLTDRATEFREAWQKLRQRVPDPFSVVFDIGGIARGNDHIHAACVRQLQKRLGYCSLPLVADFELRLEKSGDWLRFQEVARQVGHPSEVEKDQPFADEVFSEVLHHLDKDRYIKPMPWIESRDSETSRRPHISRRHVRLQSSITAKRGRSCALSGPGASRHPWLMSHVGTRHLAHSSPADIRLSTTATKNVPSPTA